MTCFLFSSTGDATFGLIFAVLCALNLLYIYLIRKRIAFAVAMLEICSDCIQSYPSTIGVSVFGLLLQVRTDPFLPLLLLVRESDHAQILMSERGDGGS